MNTKGYSVIFFIIFAGIKDWVIYCISINNINTGFLVKNSTNKLLSFLLLAFVLIGCTDEGFLKKRSITSNRFRWICPYNVSIKLYFKQVVKCGLQAKEGFRIKGGIFHIFTCFFNGTKLMRRRVKNDSVTAINLTEFVQDKNVRALYDTTQIDLRD